MKNIALGIVYIILLLQSIINVWQIQINKNLEKRIFHLEVDVRMLCITHFEELKEISYDGTYYYNPCFSESFDKVRVPIKK